MAYANRGECGYSYRAMRRLGKGFLLQSSLFVGGTTYIGMVTVCPTQ